MPRRVIAAILVVLLGGALAASAPGELQTGSEAYLRGDYAAALEVWHPLAERGDADAQLMLGIMYRAGRGVPRDDSKAAAWLRRSAERGQPSAQGILGVLYLKGEGVPQDLVTAYAYLSVAAAQDAGDSGIARDALEQVMSPEDIAEGRRMAEDCAAKGYRECGF